MAIIHKQMTPEEFAISIEKVSNNFLTLSPTLGGISKTFLGTLKNRISRSKNVNNTPMEPLTPATLNSIVTSENHTVIGLRRTLRGGNKPLYATGKLRKSLTTRVIGNDGFVMYISDSFRRMIATVNMFDRNIKPRNVSATNMSRHLAHIHKINISAEKLKTTGINIPQRIPFALNSRQIKRSVKVLNNYILKPFFDNKLSPVTRDE